MEVHVCKTIDSLRGIVRIKYSAEKGIHLMFNGEKLIIHFCPFCALNLNSEVGWEQEY